jgi:asparagine synthase (glutamine-hydrolysing)
MPGIVGIIGKHQQDEIDDELGVMLRAMHHHPHYVRGQFVEEALGIRLGWLAHPGTLGDGMPWVSEDKRVILVMVGEQFACCRTSQHDEMKEEFLRLYEKSEEDFLRSLNGWFCGVALDLNRQRVILFNDRYGMGRLYFHEEGDGFLFSSEAKSILRVRPNLRAIDAESLAQFLRFNCVMGDRSLFKGISLLPAASAWIFDGSSNPKKKRYFDYAEWEQQPTIGDDQFHDKFNDTLSKIVPSYLAETGKVALSLTAGLDTRAILAAAGDQAGPLPCYTFGGAWGETFDIRTARTLAQSCHQPFEVIRITDGFLKDFSEYARRSVYISDGTHDVVGAHDIYFNEVARGIAPVRVTGKFGSEVVRTRKVVPTGEFPTHVLQDWFVPVVKNALTINQVSQKRHPLTRAVAEEIPWYEYGRVSVEQAAITLRTPYMDNELVALMYQADTSLRASRSLQARFVKSRRPEISGIPTNMGKVRENGQLMGRIAYGLYWALFKMEFVYLFVMPHWLTRIDRKLERLKPETIIAGRQKFEGYRIWLKTHLADFVRSTLLNPQARCSEFFEKKWVEKVVEGHTAGSHNYLNELNKMLTVELIYSTLLKS